MRLLSWNVNGIRSLHKNGFLDWLYNDAPDILALQETKGSTKVFPDSLINIKGYHTFFESSKTKKGYSGVAVLSKKEPKKVEYGIGIKKIDDEGRVLVVHYEDFALINCYFPMTGRDERLSYKLEFNDAIFNYMEKLKKKQNKIILCGDLNVAHEEIDLARPKENDGRAGFRPEERAWVDELVAAGYVDTFRHLYPDRKDAYSWWDLKSRARDRNVGWRIDYFFITRNLIPKLKSAFILDHILGSDHAPVGIELSI